MQQQVSIQANGFAGMANGVNGRVSPKPSETRATTFRRWLEEQFARAEQTGKRHTEFVLVGPDEAEVLLSYSRGNRRETTPQISKYGRDATGNAWITNHQGFAFDIDRRLIDGHHRCKMLIRTGATIEVSITFGLDPRAIETVDTGVGRSNANVLELKYGSTGAKTTVAWLNNVLRIKEGLGAHRTRSFSEIDETLRAHEAAIEAARGVKGKKFVAPFWGAIIYAYPIDPETVISFAASIVSGAGLEADSPALALREYLHRLRVQKHTAGQANADDALLHTLQALRAHLEGRRITKLQVRDPKVVINWFKSRVEDE